jgi:hypothetical protein
MGISDITLHIPAGTRAYYETLSIDITYFKTVIEY